jgi:dephospho-CoA kinase
MLNVGLTGGIASGKSTVARMLAQKGALLIDLDELAHEVEMPGGEVWEGIVRHFGDGVLRPDRTIDRGKLGEVVFSDPEKLKLLNGLVHPAVFGEWNRRLQRIRETSPGAIVVSAIPLLIEAGMTGMVDLVMLVYLPPEKQMARLMERNGYTRHEAGLRIASQMPLEKKMLHADIVVNNENSEEETRDALAGIWDELTRRERARIPAGFSHVL